MNKLLVVLVLFIFLLLPVLQTAKAQPQSQLGFISPLIPTKCTTWNPFLSGQPWYMTKEKYDSYTTTICTEFSTMVGDNGTSTVTWNK